MLETIVPTIVSWLKQSEMTKSIHLKYKDQFLFDILHNNIDTEKELIELGQLRDMEFTPNTFVCSMNLNSHRTITKEIVMDIQQFLIENPLPEANIFTTYLNHRIVAIVSSFHSECISGQERFEALDQERAGSNSREIFRY